MFTLQYKPPSNYIELPSHNLGKCAPHQYASTHQRRESRDPQKQQGRANIVMDNQEHFRHATRKVRQVKELIVATEPGAIK